MQSVTLTNAKATGEEHSLAMIADRRIPWIAAAVGPVVIAPLGIFFVGSSAPAVPAQTFVGLVLLLVAGVVTYTDIHAYRIPNWVTYPAFLWGVAINAFASTSLGEPYSATLGAIGIGHSLLGAGVLFVLMLVIFSFTGGGAGDVKLVAAIGALLGMGRGIDAVTYAMVAAGAAMLLISLFKHGPIQVLDSLIRPWAWRLLPMWIDAPQEKHYQLMKTSVPLGPFFALGILLTLADAGPGLQDVLTY